MSQRDRWSQRMDQDTTNDRGRSEGRSHNNRPRGRHAPPRVTRSLRTLAAQLLLPRPRKVDTPTSLILILCSVFGRLHVWTFLTHVVVHESVLLALLNAVVLLVVGSYLESHYGRAFPRLIVYGSIDTR